MVTLKELKSMCKKYNLTISGTKKQLAQRLYNLRSDTLSKKDLKIIKDLLSTKSHTRKLKRTLKKKKKKRKTKKAGIGVKDIVDYMFHGEALVDQEEPHIDLRKIGEISDKDKLYEANLPDKSELMAYPVDNLLDVQPIKQEKSSFHIDGLKLHERNLFLQQISKDIIEAFSKIDPSDLEFTDPDDIERYSKEVSYFHVLITSPWGEDKEIPYLRLTGTDVAQLKSLQKEETSLVEKLDTIFQLRGGFVDKSALSKLYDTKYDYTKEEGLLKGLNRPKVVDKLSYWADKFTTYDRSINRITGFTVFPMDYGTNVYHKIKTYM
tara:strand:+ start:950 stop:1915 length:966 start_codon:yes stop_codon:yes gene_type:complete